MPSICPVCNGMQNLGTPCPRCSKSMEDYGQLHSLLAPYAPYEEDELLQQSNDSVYEGYCQHLACCPHCNFSMPVKVSLVPGTSTVGPTP
ncbi:MAG: hypothetical protein GX060_04165 [Firmicutes bacterium]|nr:hypothetical protein [Bacillota bacterium]